jgi:hypothetical protein
MASIINRAGHRPARMWLAFVLRESPVNRPRGKAGVIAAASQNASTDSPRASQAIQCTARSRHRQVTPAVAVATALSSAGLGVGLPHVMWPLRPQITASDRLWNNFAVEAVGQHRDGG